MASLSLARHWRSGGVRAAEAIIQDFAQACIRAQQWQTGCCKDRGQGRSGSDSRTLKSKNGKLLASWYLPWAVSTSLTEFTFNRAPACGSASRDGWPWSVTPPNPVPHSLSPPKALPGIAPQATNTSLSALDGHFDQITSGQKSKDEVGPW